MTPETVEAQSATQQGCAKLSREMKKLPDFADDQPACAVIQSV